MNEIPSAILKRKGARTTATVPNDVRELLNAGRIESVNLCEWLIVDHAQLAENVLPELGLDAALEEIRQACRATEKLTALKQTFAVGNVLAQHLENGVKYRKAIRSLQKHPSDSVRTWGCAVIGERTSASLADRLEAMRPFASDSNMGVREIAWMAVRDHIAADLEEAFRVLADWVLDKDDRIRRFASEATRPRGVWCSHITRLREEPELGLPILTPLKSDPSKYVRDSVANWLNDASRTQPQFVRQVTEQWLKESSTRETKLIVQRATRTLRKAGKTLSFGHEADSKAHAVVSTTKKTRSKRTSK
ncbi:MAG: DNA alkylation repair protein [Planctomycetaceae bacterium]|nr:DNA alkylation repair protein [Planctomycetaceae bacterium]